jgi:hypothetical protein
MNNSAYLVSGIGSILVAIALQGCGGGGAPGAEVLSSQSIEAARLAENPASPDAWPLTYRVTFQDVLGGGAGTAFYSFRDLSRGRVFDTQGRFVASLGPPVSLPHAILAPPVQRQGAAQEEWSYATGISPNGIFIGVTFDQQFVSRGFAVSADTTYFMPPDTTAHFVSTSGLVGGYFCPGGGQPPGCPDGNTQAIHWRPATGAVELHPGFEPVWMNDAGRMLGYRQLPNGARELATVDPEGIPRPLGFEPEAGFSAQARFIADDGTVFLEVADDPNNARRGSAVVLIADCVPVVVGRVAVRPALCERKECVERTRFTAFSATGHAVGEHAWLYRDDAGDWQFAATASFHWSPKDGSSAIEGAGAGLPYMVNAHGAVLVGGAAVRTPSSQDGEAEPHLWKKGAGAVALRSVLFPDGSLTPETRFFVIALGDGGQLLVGLSHPLELESSLLLFTPDTAP